MFNNSKVLPLANALIQFLEDFSWLFNFSNVKVFELNVFDTWPVEWLNYLKSLTSPEDLKLALTDDSTQNNVPSFVKDFIDRRNHLVAEIQSSLFHVSDSATSGPKLSQHLGRGMTPKKLHEVQIFSAYVNNQVSRSDFPNSTIVDIGSGLGYVDSLLKETFGHDVVAVEGNSGFTERALDRHKSRKQRQKNFENDLKKVEANFIVIQSQKNFENDLKKAPVNHVNFHLNESTSNWLELERLIRTDSDSLFLIGLHACGDLTPAMLRWYTKSDRVKGISVVSCCYHKMTSFPMSNALQSIKASSSLFARRVACQDSFQIWLERTNEQHAVKAQQFGLRATAEVCASSKNISVEKLRRKCFRQSDSPDSLDQHLQFKSKLTNTKMALSEFDADLQKLRLKFETFFPILELMTGLQTVLQLPLELLIVTDRILFLRESGFEKTFSERIFDERISPRGIVITSTK